MRPLEVEIFNTQLTVWSGENAAYLEALAAEVDTRIQQIYTTSTQISPLRAAIMAAYPWHLADVSLQAKRVGILGIGGHCGPVTQNP